MASICEIPLCNKELRAKGLCMMHYTRKRKGQPLNNEPLTGGPRPFIGCEVAGCEGNHYAKHMCRFHYNRAAVGTDLTRPLGQRENAKEPDALCEFFPCGRKEHSGGYCRTHYMQKWLGKPMTILRGHNRAFFDEGGKVCTKCFSYRGYDEFYTRDNGKTKSHCKECMIAMAALRQAIRKGQVTPQWAVDYLANL
jgi:hypothetical protein